MKIDRNALKEAGVDTLLGAIVNFPLSWLTLSIVLVFTTNSFILSLSQLIILSFWQSSADITQGSIFKIVTRGRVVAKTWVKEKIDSIKKKTSIGNSHLSNGSGTNKRRTKKVYRGQGK
jgi:hypothetical protein